MRFLSFAAVLCLAPAAPESLSGRMRAQTETAIAQADVIFFLVDARAGITPADSEFAALVRKIDKVDRSWRD